MRFLTFRPTYSDATSLPIAFLCTALRGFPTRQKHISLSRGCRGLRLKGEGCKGWILETVPWCQHVPSKFHLLLKGHSALQPTIEVPTCAIEKVSRVSSPISALCLPEAQWPRRWHRAVRAQVVELAHDGPWVNKMFPKPNEKKLPEPEGLI